MATIKKLKDLKAGDMLPGSQGPVTVTKVYEAHLPETMWELESETGEKIKVSGNHLWYCESLLDWELLRVRKATARRALKHVTAQALALLEETAEKTELVETSLADMLTLVQASKSEELVDVVVRVAEAIGHIAENTSTLDALDAREVTETTIRSYDGGMFAQQLLSLTGKRAYRRYKLIVGSVMTTNQLVELMDIIEIPIAKPFR